MSDADLLQRYVESGSESAFAALVDRYLDLVYSVARRHVSPSLAEDVAQSVFIELARRARDIKPGTPLVAWLHVVSRRIALNTVRDAARRDAREKQAVEIATMKPEPSAWRTVEPLLDEAVESLAEPDRTAILLRYFQNKSHRDIGVALGTSDDAAQKRVSRAVEQLREFFLRRGITVTAAGLATDLSAHALHLAPAGLGAAITSAASLPIVTAAVVETSRVLVMTTLQKSVALTAFAAVAGVGMFEAVVVARQSDGLSTLRAETERAVAAIRTLRTEQDGAVARLKNVERQIDARLAASVATSSADAALENQMKDWLTRVDRLKQVLTQRPELNIPELSLLRDDIWFDVAVQAQPLDTDEAVRQTLSRLRHSAENQFAVRLSTALRAYLTVHSNTFPSSPLDVAPFFDPPVDRAMLERYEVSPPGKLPGASPAARGFSFVVKQPADPEFDALWWVSATAQGNMSALGVNYTDALRRFTEANPGQRPTNAAQLRPYLKWPVRDEAVQKALDYPPTRSP